MSSKKDNKVEYPRMWEYCVFGNSSSNLKKVVEEILPNHEGISDSKSTKKFISKKVKHFVNSEDERNELYERLKGHPEILYIL